VSLNGRPEVVTPDAAGPARFRVLLGATGRTTKENGASEPRGRASSPGRPPAERRRGGRLVGYDTPWVRMLDTFREVFGGK